MRVTPLRCKKVKTRTVHNCFGCLREIPKGSEAESWSAVDGSSVYSGYNCLDCVREIHAYTESEFPSGCFADLDYARNPIAVEALK